MKIRAFVPALLLLAVVACGGDSPTETDIVDDPLPVGEMTLTSIMGETVPVLMIDSECAGPGDTDDAMNTFEEEIVGGVFQFIPEEGTYFMTIEGRTRCVTPDGDATDWEDHSFITEGDYDGGPTTFHLWDTVDVQPTEEWLIRATFADGELTLRDRDTHTHLATFAE